MNPKLALGICMLLFLFSILNVVFILDAVICNDVVRVEIDHVSLVRYSFSVSFSISSPIGIKRYTYVGLLSPFFLKNGSVEGLRGNFYIFLKPMVVESLLIWLLSASICFIPLFFELRKIRNKKSSQ